MEHYVTLFDSMFLPQGLALHRSLERHAGSYKLWILCVDDRAHEVLTKLSLPNVELISIRDAETAALQKVKPERSTGEYCWTLTPRAPQVVLERNPEVKRVTYVDADFWFRQSPAPIFAEFDESKRSVLMTDHAYAPENDQTNTSGQYCVQFLTFARGAGETVLAWWMDRCVEWCFARFEDGKFGDQKYLEQWPSRFPADVHVLRQQELILMPWSSMRFPYGPSVAYHFHGLRLLRNEKVLLLRGYDIPLVTQRAVYTPYLEDLAHAVAALRKVGHVPPPQATVPNLFIRFGILWKKLHRAVARWRPVVTRALPRVNLLQD